ncbi:uncharacterized protein JCM6883_007296 [Sporobolomyces salmoneus]|uniref:uncharacterized protein n=1 Tax=Sporobolomyces salmoneus TaxID=183962 RepID=UPI00316CA56B
MSSRSTTPIPSTANGTTGGGGFVTPLSSSNSASSSPSIPQMPTYSEWDDESFGTTTRSSHNDRLETLKGVANRFVFSQFYVFLYLGMAALSLTTVFLSATNRDNCPSFTFYVLEVIVNSAMIIEVSIRFFAFGRQFWSSHFNTLDLLITLLCLITLLVIVFKGCSAKDEEVFDTFLLVVRNLFQFGRLALVLRKSGKNVFSRPAPIDLSSARAYSLDLDLDDEEALAVERRALGGDVEAEGRRKGPSEARGEGRGFLTSRESDEDD